MIDMNVKKIFSVAFLALIGCSQHKLTENNVALYVKNNETEFVCICESDNGTLKAYIHKIDEFKDQKEIIVLDCANSDYKICRLHERCDLNISKISRLTNGDVALILLQGSGSGFHLEQLIILQSNGNKLIPVIRSNANALLEQAKKTSVFSGEFSGELSEKEISIENLISKKKIIIPVSSQVKEQFPMNYNEFKKNKWRFCYSPNIITFENDKVLTAKFVVVLQDTETFGEIVLGEVLFNLKFSNKNKTLNLGSMM